jgi:large subunit ribosomal protein L7Ae
MPSKKTTSKTPAPAPKTGSAPAKKTSTNKNAALFEKRPRIFGIGGNLRPKSDLTRFVRWPRYVKIQRQKRILLQRLKVPPAINQFSKALDKNHATVLFKLLNKYKPETDDERRKRVVAAAAQKAKEGEKAQPPSTDRNLVVQYGLNHITTLVEQKKAKLVVIAHDVEPVELVLWLPALCRRMDVPYVIVKGKARLGAVVHKKTAAVVALTNVKNEDKNELALLTQIAQESFNKNVEARRAWGGARLGVKSLAAIRKKEKALAKEKAGREGK